MKGKVLDQNVPNWQNNNCTIAFRFYFIEDNLKNIFFFFSIVEYYYYSSSLFE